MRLGVEAEADCDFSGLDLKGGSNYIPGAKPIHVHTDGLRTERVNEEILHGRKRKEFISTCIIMCIDFVVTTSIIMYCRTDIQQN